MVDISRVPTAQTVTLTAATVQLQLISATGKEAHFAKNVIIMNNSASNVINISFRANATQDTEEFTLGAGGSMTLDFTRSGARDVFVRGTSGQKFSYIVL